MPFPIEPLHGEPETQFLIQDPFGLRAQIFPILTINKDDGALTGLGTAFQVDAFGTYLTAEHVLKSLSEDPAARENEVAAILFPMGIVFGQVRLPKEYFAPIRGAMSWQISNTQSTPIRPSTSRSIVADLMRFHADTSKVPGNPHPHPLPLRLAGRLPQVGDRVMTIGYPELRGIHHVPAARASVLIERMFGAVGVIRAMLPEGRGTTYPWPAIEIETHWRSGMSGGPIFNEAGEVIGLVSSSLEPDGDLPGVGFATDLSRVDLARLVPTIDPVNPGWSRGWGVVRSASLDLSAFFPTKALAEDHCNSLGSNYQVRFGSCRNGTNEFVVTDSL